MGSDAGDGILAKRLQTARRSTRIVDTVSLCVVNGVDV
jgi:hypothetical protein